MELSTARYLADFNRRFYEAHALNFADSRPRLGAGARRVLELIRPGARVLELGCGDGKVARALAGGEYVGVDQSEGMIERAERLMEARGRSPEVGENLTSDVRLLTSRFIRADLTDPDWTSALPPGLFDWVLAFGVFHHLPRAALRRAVLAQAAELLKPGGRAAMANWQFTRSERLRRRLRPWAEAGLDDSALEPGDYLLSWERKASRGLRYVHLLEQDEARAMAQAAGLRVSDVFQSDGVSDNLSEYVIMQQPP